MDGQAILSTDVIFFDQWKELAAFVFNDAKSTKDKYFKTVVNKIKLDSEIAISIGALLTLAVHFAVCQTTIQSTNKEKKTYHRTTKIESQKLFLHLVNVSLACKSIVHKMYYILFQESEADTHEKELKEEFPVFVYLVGNLEEPNSIKSVSNIFDKRDVHENPYDGLDLVIKSFFAFDIGLPPKSSALWVFLIRLIYKSNRPQEARYMTPSISRFINRITYLNNAQNDLSRE